MNRALLADIQAHYLDPEKKAYPDEVCVFRYDRSDCHARIIQCSRSWQPIWRRVVLMTPSASIALLLLIIISVLIPFQNLYHLCTYRKSVSTSIPICDIPSAQVSIQFPSRYEFV